MHNAECIISEVLRTWIYKAPYNTSFYGGTKLYRQNRRETNYPRAASLDAETIFLPRSWYFVYCELAKQCRMHNAECIISEVLRTWIYKAPHKTSFYGVTKLYRQNRRGLHSPRAASLDAETVFLPPMLYLYCELRSSERQNRRGLHSPRAASLDAETVFLPRSRTLCTASGEKTVRKTKKARRYTKPGKK